jgi:hypothetical protein
MEELAWQYSLRSNLLLFGSGLAAYLIQRDERAFLLAYLVVFGWINVLTDIMYRYPRASLFPTVRKGHRVAAMVITTAGVLYFGMLMAATNS